MNFEDLTPDFPQWYYPFGEPLNNQVLNSHKFTGKELDEESGLYYFCQRYYDSNIGRFASLDLIPTPSTCRYSYCLNNPLKYIDIDGAIITYPGTEWAALSSWPPSLRNLMINVFIYKYMNALGSYTVNIVPMGLRGDIVANFTEGKGYFGKLGLNTKFLYSSSNPGYEVSSGLAHELWHAYFACERNVLHQGRFRCTYEEEAWVWAKTQTAGTKSQGFLNYTAAMISGATIGGVPNKPYSEYGKYAGPLPPIPGAQAQEGGYGEYHPWDIMPFGPPPESPEEPLHEPPEKPPPKPAEEPLP